jgi:hypothetical protein
VLTLKCRNSPFAAIGSRVIAVICICDASAKRIEAMPLKRIPILRFGITIIFAIAKRWPDDSLHQHVQVERPTLDAA